MRLVELPAGERAPVLHACVRIAASGRKHFPVAPDATIDEFVAIAGRYPVFRIDPVYPPAVAPPPRASSRAMHAWISLISSAIGRTCS
ncbi:MAG TPA: hypothetical protein VFY79_09825, partial [Dehalococcoidia bacterium]|nr:hypothetical protein [Dehalococcoidia bacterium]